jgi:dTDP-4-amino-4,6-dideoxygalactose transaminase
MMRDFPAILGGSPASDELLPMVRPVLPEFPEMSDGIQNILSTGMVTKGRYMRAFEEAIAQHLDVKHAIALSSCTSGLMLACKALGLTGDVVVPSFTFMATVSSLIWCGLRPVFADVDLESHNLDPESARAAITPETTAIVAVHQFGNPADMEALERLAREHNLALIFDAAHGFGALYQGQPVGDRGDAQVFSLSPTKLLIAGEGGMVATNRGDLAGFIRMGREYGNNGKYDSLFAGLNARMPEFSALMGLHSLDNLEQAAQNRNRTAGQYQDLLGAMPGIGFQHVRPGDRHSYREFSITIDADKFGLTRDQLAEALSRENVDSRKYYDPPVHRQTAYREFYDGRPLPNTEWLSHNSLSLPMWSHMSPQVVGIIGEAIRRIHVNAQVIRNRLVS